MSQSFLHTYLQLNGGTTQCNPNSYMWLYVTITPCMQVLGNRQEAFSKDCWQAAIDMVMFLFMLALTC